MLDHDISAADARRSLSSRFAADELGPHGWTRRGFLQAVGMGLGGGALAGTLGETWIPGDVREAYAGTPIGPGDGIVVTIMLYGGNDGLNTLIPYGNGLYYQQRANIAVPQAQVLTIDSQVGLHPRLPKLRARYAAGKVAIVQGVGYPNPNLSHFSSMAIWMNAQFGGGGATNGWIGRWLDGLSPSAAELGAATIDSSVALHLIGATRRAVGISPWGDMFGTKSEPSDERMYAGMRAMASASAGRGPWHDTFAATMRGGLNLAREVAPVFSQALPNNGLVRKMTIAARLINANVGLRIIDVGLDGFDNHDDQLANHPNLLGQLDDAIDGFYAALSPDLHDRVTIMTMSEFGRTSFSNDSGGTDHGTASEMFVIGERVKGGLYGQAPSMAGLDRWDRMAHHVDFRAVIGSVVDGWMGGGGGTILNGPFENLGLFNGAPGTGDGSGPVIVLPPAEPSGFVSIAPLRVFDTRDGTGGRQRALGGRDRWTLTLAGRYGIPADAVAVAINVTSVDASSSTYITAYPRGEARPGSSHLNPVPGAAIPNLVVGRLGLNGAIDLYNHAGDVHLIGDVVGFFSPAAKGGLLPLTPARLLDTRVGTGARVGVIGSGQSIDLQVTGRGGVPSSCQSVALNVTATDVTESTFLTVWPTGQPRPVASSVNAAAGQTVPNMILARIGTGGKVSILNYSGATHVIVDVLGAFSDTSTSRFITLSPSRVLDTRSGVGAPRARVGQAPLTLGLAGRGGVPAESVAAVLLNVTAVAPTVGTYISVYPNGIARPVASNLNAAPGQVVANTVLARLGDAGAVQLYNNDGTVDLVADVMGYFTA